MDPAQEAQSFANGKTCQPCCERGLALELAEIHEAFHRALLDNVLRFSQNTRVALNSSRKLPFVALKKGFKRLIHSSPPNQRCAELRDE